MSIRIKHKHSKKNINVILMSSIDKNNPIKPNPDKRIKL